MEVVNGFAALAALAAPLRAPVVTIGNFDGVHRGHLALFAHVRERAAAIGGQSVVYTFEPHPVQILAPKLAPPRLTPAREKQHWLAAAGIDVCIAEPFTHAYAQTPAEQFVSQVLVSAIGMRELVVGYDFTYGRGGAGNTGTLAQAAEQFGFALQIINQQTFSGVVASSTKIREFVLEGKVDGARLLLGRDYSVVGEVVHGDARGRTIGFPTANIDAEETLVPRNGVYACWLDVGGERRGAVSNIGLRPTVAAGVTKPTVEAHVFDFDGDLYGQEVRLSFVQRLRDEQRFASLDALKAQIAQDTAEARRVLA
jgi:riboflavin kinase/FMN adenylyltransferase